MGITFLKNTSVRLIQLLQKWARFAANEPCIQRPISSVSAQTISLVKRIVHANQWIISNEALNEVGILRASAHIILTE
jgi:hypothetical protein